jgi:PAS domain S-box-containing protein
MTSNLHIWRPWHRTSAKSAVGDDLVPRQSSDPPEHETEARATRLVRIGFIVIFAYQMAHLFTTIVFAKQLTDALWTLHFLSISSTVVAMGLTWSTWFGRRWRELVFVDCAALVLSTVGVSAITAEPTQFFIAVVLLQLGVAALIPWGVRWQGAFTVVCVFAAVIGLFVIAGEFSIYRWLEFGTASALSLVVAALSEWSRAEVQTRIEGLEGDELKLWKIFEEYPDAVTINRLSDGRYLNVSAEFLKSGYTRDEALAASDAELGIWANHDEREEYWRQLRSRGYVRNLEALLRHKDGRTVPCLVSAVTIEFGQSPCAISVLRDISVIKRAEREMVAARVAAEAASHAKSGFLSSMSHEIRQPMNAILGMAEVLGESDLSSEQRKYLSIMINNGNALLELINDILDFSRIESGRLKFERIDFDLCDLAERVAETLSIRAHQKGLELVVHITPEVPSGLIGDPLRLRQILVNLLGNAIKFTEKGEVVLTVEPQPGADPGILHFSVRDTGIGIAPDQREKIFTSYAQAEASTARKYGGTGLGLAIVKQLVELMSGRIWVESEIGTGSTFHFTANFGLQPRGLGESADAATTLEGARILVVDHNAVNRLVLTEILAGQGAIVNEASCGEEAMKALRTARRKRNGYAAVLLDCRMREMDGDELAQQLRRERFNAGMVIPMLNADDLNVRLPAMRRLGFIHHLIKPVRRVELRELIKTILSQKRRAVAASEPQAEAVPPPSVAVLFEPAAAALAVPALAPEPERALRILVADDSADNRLLIEAFIKKAGWSLDHADNGETAVQMFKSGKYDVVLMDIKMPVMDGYVAAQLIREWEREHDAARTPIIALTASVLDEAVGKSFEVGCDNHVSKPVRRPALLAAIREVTGAAQSETHPPQPAAGGGRGGTAFAEKPTFALAAPPTGSDKSA